MGGHQRRYDNGAPGSADKYFNAPKFVLFLLPLLGLSRDSETEITVKSAALLQVTKPKASYILPT